MAELLDVVASIVHSPAAQQEAADATPELAEFRARRAEAEQAEPDQHQR